jgi:hypothetical protein
VPIAFFFEGLDGKYIPPAFAGAEEFRRGRGKASGSRLLQHRQSEGRAAIHTLVVAIADALEKRPRMSRKTLQGRLLKTGANR